MHTLIICLYREDNSEWGLIEIGENLYFIINCKYFIVVGTMELKIWIPLIALSKLVIENWFN